jgi:alanine dehydrogenase
MRFIDADAVRALAPMAGLIARLEAAFREEWIAPIRQVVSVPGGAGTRVFLSMPAFDPRGSGAVKLLSFFPDNPDRGLPTIQAAIVVFSESGAPVAVLDGRAVTCLRTGAASALASKYLSRSDSAHLLLIGTGALAPYMALGHCAIRPIERITVWGRRSERAESAMHAIRALIAPTVAVAVSEHLEEAVAAADIISCATASSSPVLEGRWLRSGVFVDLVGSFSPTNRESDDEVVSRARIFVDTRAGAFAEAGDILDPLQRGVISKDKILGELSDLVRGRCRGRTHPEEITLFKSVGTAIEDLAAAQLIVGAAINEPKA